MTPRNASGGRVAPLIALVIAPLCWSGNFVFAPAAIAELGPVGLSAGRWIIAAPLLVIVALVVERPRLREVVRTWRFQVTQSLTGIVGFTIFTYLAVEQTAPVNAALVQSLNPAAILVLSAIVMQAWPGRRPVIGALVSLVGVAGVVGLPVLTGEARAADSGHGSALLGVGYMVAAVLCWAVYSVNGRRAPAPPITSTAAQAIIGVVLTTPFAMAMGSFNVSLSLPALGALVFIGIFPSAVSTTCWNFGVSRVGAERAGIFTNLLPLFTAGLSVALGGRISWGQIVGGVLIIAGVLITTGLPRRKRASPPAIAEGDAGERDAG